ncbi:DUF2312 domain-containing protein [Salipiger marinus]|uniref:Uncharacterized conserved protein, UPF0335 family n=1 Tax=Salipiger marinus TaxID=555512 RepID=A0A1G8RZZ3_9RHOB|nr:DUF2312 domain-containing protein [Salipiger marinus]SDJ21980.1 Uncharacterized conserved protein, UPF0335 family [Salipiger marinus]
MGNLLPFPIGLPCSPVGPRPPMKETAADRALRDTTYDAAAEELRQFVERFEQLEVEKQTVADQQKALMAEAKARGYVPKLLRVLIAQRKRDRDDLAEEEAKLALYKDALGMGT